jgi:H(+)-translocating pyrophosphatase
MQRRLTFTGGAVMGFIVIGLGLFGVCLMFFLVSLGYADLTDRDKLRYAADTLAGFGFGASSVALFARVAGGIYTKAADVGADLVGKVEMDIPEEDPRNPPVIADNVGDNVDDVVGLLAMGADLFDFYVGSIIATFYVGSIIATVSLAQGDIVLVMLPFWISGAAIVAAVIGYFVVGTKENATQKVLLNALLKGTMIASIMVTGFSSLIIAFLFAGRESEGWKLFGCTIIGLLAGILIGQVTEYFTSYHYWPTKSITPAGTTGPATVIIQGLGIGMISTVFPVLILVTTILGCDTLSGSYGIAMSAVGMLSTLGVNLATDAYDPVADNAGGIAEMAELDERVRDTTDTLDALGNTNAATGKGFAIGSAVVTALSLLAAFKKKAGILIVDTGDPVVFSGVLIGAMLREAAPRLILTSVLPFRHKVLWRRWFFLGLYAILSPITVGFLIGPTCLVGLLAGATASGMMLALMMANAGGAWDNSKKYIEIEGAHGGNTVGDPFKDTSGPSLNILIKLMSIIAFTIARLMEAFDTW